MDYTTHRLNSQDAPPFGQNFLIDIKDSSNKRYLINPVSISHIEILGELLETEMNIHMSSGAVIHITHNGFSFLRKLGINPNTNILNPIN